MSSKTESSARYYQQSKQTKSCPSCKQVLPLTQFPVSKKRKSGRASHCKQCRKLRYPYQGYRKKAVHIRHRYGIEWHDYLEMYEKQNKQCAICQTPLELNYTTHVDHCHKTNTVRGLLCANCNKGLGNFKDSGIFLRNAAKYVEQNEN